MTGNISGTGRVIDFVFDSSLGFSGITELLLVVPNPRWQLATILEVSNDDIAERYLSRPVNFLFDSS